MTDYTDAGGNPCSMVDECAVTQSITGVYNFLMANFKKHYESNRSPFPMFMHAGWLVRFPNTLQGKPFPMFMHAYLFHDSLTKAM